MGSVKKPPRLLHVEAKTTAGGSYDESVSWTESFQTIPVVTVTANNESLSDASYMGTLDTKSTTSAGVESWDDTGTGVATQKEVIAREPS